MNGSSAETHRKIFERVFLTNLQPTVVANISLAAMDKNCGTNIIFSLPKSPLFGENRKSTLTSYLCNNCSVFTALFTVCEVFANFILSEKRSREELIWIVKLIIILRAEK